MFSILKGAVGQPVEQFLEPDERVIWVDRFNPARPRMRRTGHQERRSAIVDCLLALGASAGLTILVLQPDFTRSLFRDWVNPIVYLLPAGLICLALLAVTVHRVRCNLRGTTTVIEDYVLTNQRVMVLMPWFKKAEIFELKEISSVRLVGRSLALEGLAHGEAVLFDLADPTAALRAFQEWVASSGPVTR